MPESLDIDSEQFWARFVAGDYAGAHDLVEGRVAALPAHAETGDWGLDLAWMLMSLAQEWPAGLGAGRPSYLRRAEELATDQYDVALANADQLTAARAALTSGWALVAIGDLAAAKDRLDIAAQTYTPQAWPQEHLWVLRLLADVARRRGDYATARSLLDAGCATPGEGDIALVRQALDADRQTLSEREAGLSRLRSEVTSVLGDDLADHSVDNTGTLRFRHGSTQGYVHVRAVENDVHAITVTIPTNFEVPADAGLVGWAAVNATAFPPGHLAVTSRDGQATLLYVADVHAAGVGTGQLTWTVSTMATQADEIDDAVRDRFTGRTFSQ